MRGPEYRFHETEGLFGNHDSQLPNCTHIANASLRLPIESVCREHGYEPPVICTPDELLQREDQDNG